MTEVPAVTAERAVPPVPRHLLGPDGVIQRVRLAAYAWCERDESVLTMRAPLPGAESGSLSPGHLPGRPP